MLYLGDMLTVLDGLDANSVHACVCDPPYDLVSISQRFGKADSVPAQYGSDGLFQRKARGFMGQSWDGTGIAFRPETWVKVLRVMRPGAYLLAFGGTRTSHRMVCAIEDAGFIIRDSLVWLHAQGFPKSHNLGDGRGTALKPAHEPIVLAQKPLDGTYAANVERWGCGALNIDAARLGTDSTIRSNRAEMGYHGGNLATEYTTGHAAGRWPANVVLSCCGSEPHDADCAVALLDAQSGVTTSTGGTGDASKQRGGVLSWTPSNTGGFGDTGGASRFFFVAKPSRAERKQGLAGMPEETRPQTFTSSVCVDPRPGRVAHERPPITTRNIHPTVKSIALMRHLLTLVVPPNGTVLDPFAGSGSTLVAAIELGMGWIGVEQEPAYHAICAARILDAELRMDAAAAIPSLFDLLRVAS